MAKRYPRTLSSGANNTVIALSETEVAKLFHADTRADLGSEAEKMRYANEPNLEFPTSSKMQKALNACVQGLH